MRWSRFGAPVAMLLAIGLCAAPLFSSSRVAGYRDALHFYYPLYHWLATTWGAGQLPLWNPDLGMGTPIVAETTSAVFYPAKLVFCLPVSMVVRYNLYIILHLLLAAIATYHVSRQWRASRPAAALAGSAYALGGNVLFQYCNVPLLVGAAWLPVALGATDRLLRHGGWSATLQLAVALALMTLGGDPQMAYNVMLAALLYAWLTRHRGALTARRDHASRRFFGGFSRNLLRLFGVGVVAALLTAIQWVPASAWTRASRRAEFRNPRSIYEAVTSASARHRIDFDRPAGGAGSNRLRAIAAGLFGPPAAGTHHHDVYEFSVAPTRFAEFVWPNVSGRMFPENHRWLRAAGGEARIWTPSLYLGLVPLVLALSALKLRHAHVRVRWLSWMVVLSGVGSLGVFGPAMIVNAASAALRTPPTQPLGDAVGGVYWFFVTLLPGYVLFRYPAKLLVCASLGISLVAGHQLDRIDQRATREQVRNWLSCVALVSALLLVVLMVMRAAWPGWFSGSRADELYGPLDAVAGWNDVVRGVSQAIVVSLLARTMLHVKVWRGSRSRYLLLIVTGIEVAVANHWMVLTVPARAVAVRTVLHDCRALREPGQHADQVRYYRRPDRQWVPSRWQRTSSSERAVATAVWDRRTLLPNLHLLDRQLAAIAPRMTLVPVPFAVMLARAGRADPSPEQLSLLGTRYVILPTKAHWPAAAGMELLSSSTVDNVSVWRNPHAFPRAWIVHAALGSAAISATGIGSPSTRTRNIGAGRGNRQDWRRVVLLPGRTTAMNATSASDDRGGPTNGETCRIVSRQANQVVIEACLHEPGWIVMSDLYYPGWTAQAVANSGATLPLTVQRANQSMRAVALPAGHWRVTQRYQPGAWWCAAIVSALAWCGLLFGVIMWRRRRGSAGSVSPS